MKERLKRAAKLLTSDNVIIAVEVVAATLALLRAIDKFNKSRVKIGFKK